MTSCNAIEIKNLEFSYQENNRIISIDELIIPLGQKVFLYGPSGCGKSTLLNLISGILLPTSGNIKILDTSIESLKGHARDKFRGQNIGVIFQSFNLIEYLSVLENIELPARLFPHVSTPQKIPLRQRSKEALIALDLINLENRAVSDLSIGQRQRVAAARAFILSPAIIIADEPTSSLDEHNTQLFMQSLFKLSDNLQAKNKTTIIFVSHDLRLKEYFDQVISLPDLNKDSKTSY